MSDGTTTLLYRFLGIDEGAGAEFDKMTAKTEGLGHSSSTALAAIRKLALGATVAGLTIAVGSVKMAGDFQAAMLRIQTQANGSHKEVVQLSNGILKMAGTVATAPIVLADAAYHIASIGQKSLTAAQQLQVLKIATEGAKIGGANLTDVTNALDAAIVSHIKGVNNYSQAMGVLNSTVGAGDMTMQDLADAFGPLGAVLKGYNVTIKQAGAALAVFGDNNIRGAKAGTNLRMAVQSLAVPVKNGQDQLEAWGIKTGNLTKQLEHGGLTDALDTLMKKMRENGVTAKTQGDVLTNMFGKRAGTGIAVLMAELDRYHTKLTEVGQGANTFASSWKAYTKSFGYAWDSAKASAESFLITLGEKLLPIATRLMKWITTTAVPALSEFADYLKKNSDVAKGLGIILGGLALALGGPITVITALVTGFVLLYKRSSEFRDIVKDVGGYIAQFAAWINNKAVPAVEKFAEYLKKNRGAAIAVGAAIAGLALLFGGPITVIATLVAGFVVLYKRSSEFRSITKATMRDAVTAWGWLKNAAIQTYRFIVGTAIPDIIHAYQDVKAVVMTVYGALKSATETVMHAIGAAWNWFANGPLAYVKARIADFTSWYSDHAQQIREVTTKVWDVIAATTRIAWETIKNIIMTTFKVAMDFLKPALSVLESGFRTAWDAVKDIVHTAIKVVGDTLKTFEKTALDFVGVILDLITGKWGKAWSEAKKFVFDGIEGVVKVLDDFASGAVKLLYDVGKDIVRGLINGIKSMAGAAKGAIEDIGGGIVHGAKSLLHIGSPSKLFFQYGIWIVEGLVNGVKSYTINAKDVAKQLALGFITGWKDGTAKLKDELSSPVQKALEKLTTVVADAIAKQKKLLTTAQDNLKNILSARKSAISSLAGNISSGADLSGLFGTDANGNATTANISTFLGGQAKQIENFAKDLKWGAKHGLSAALLTEIAGLGATQGDAVLKEFMTGAASIKSANASEAAIQKYSTVAATTVEDKVYAKQVAEDRKAVKENTTELKKLTKALDKTEREVAKEISTHLYIDAKTGKPTVDKDFINEIIKGILKANRQAGKNLLAPSPTGRFQGRS